MHVRAAADSDFPFLVDILLHAFNWSGEQTFTKDQLLNNPAISHYAAGWKREQDFGTVAETGAGTALLRAVVEQAQGLGFDALSLSVEDSNPARRLYERAGFRKVDRNGDSDTMLLRLS